MTHTVLVADDSRTIRQIVGMALKASPYDILEADNAQATVLQLQQRGRDISVILLDYYMPDGSGYELCRAVKSNDSTRDIPVIMLGGTYKNFDEGKAREVGADGIVMKPFKTDQLLHAIESAIGVVHQAIPSAPSQPAPPPPNPFSSAQPQRQQVAQDVLSRPLPQAPPSQRPAPQAPPVEKPVAQPMHPLPPSPAAPSAPASSPAPPAVSAPAVDASGVNRDELEAMVTELVKSTVREELPGMLRNVVGDLLQKKLMPRMVQQVDQRINERVRAELESLLAELE
ncbi:MAG: response regulator [Myxococcota bacterium]